MTPDEIMTAAIATVGGTGALVLLGKWIVRQAFEIKGEVANNTLINNLVEDIKRLRENEVRMESRLEALEEKLSGLLNRLVTVRSHALFAHQVATTNDPITGETRQHVINTLTLIIKDE